MSGRHLFRKVGLGVLLLVGIASAVAFLEKTIDRDLYPHLEKYREIRRGMAEHEVIRLLGKPDKLYDEHSAPRDYYVKGYARKERPISSKVLIYMGRRDGDVVIYIWVDRRGFVEETFIGPS